MIKWKRLSGTFIETGESEGCLAVAEREGWVRVDGTTQEPDNSKSEASVDAELAEFAEIDAELQAELEAEADEEDEDF